MSPKPSLRGINLLFLIVLCLQAGNFLFMWLPQHVRMILNEALFVFLPALLYLRFTRQPIAARVRWTWPGWKVAILALLVGAGLYPISIASAGIFQYLLGYTNFTAPADVLPTTIPTAILAVIAYAVMAPVCEEFLFRGVIQPAYEMRSASRAVLFVGLLFIIFHLSLLQGLIIIPLSLALGYVNYRARSLPASMLTHFGANAMAALMVTHQVFKTGFERWVAAPPALLGGLVVALVSLAALQRLTRAPAPTADQPLPAPFTPVSSGAPARLLAQGWPLLAALLLYLPVIGSEFYYSRSPEATAGPLQVSPVTWGDMPAQRYEIRNVLDTVIGEGECRLEPGAERAEVICTSQVEAYEARVGNSYYAGGAGQFVSRFTWQPADGRLVAGSSESTFTDGSYQSVTSFSIEMSALATPAGPIKVQVDTQGEPQQVFELPFSQTPLAGNPALLVVHHESWPWQLAGLQFEAGVTGKVILLRPYTWRNATEDNGPLVESKVVSVHGPEIVTTPAGTFHAWRVTLGNEGMAWYERSDNHTLVKFFDGVETWFLTK